MKHILIVEDDAFLLKALTLKLQKLNFEVSGAVDGGEALKLLNSIHPDLIILDLVMPVKDGFQVLEELKNNNTLQEIPVVVASNLGQKEDITRALALGARDYLVKSEISLDELGSKIAHLLQA